jgi:large subunit ribosomal protein L4
MELKMVNDKGGAGTFKAPDEVFARDFNEALVHQIVVAFQANARIGSRAQKDRGAVRHSTKKPWRQKGTGRARAGTTRAPQWTGGGVAFAPQPRSYALKVNRKARKSALRGALSYHAGQSAFGVVDASAFSEPSTRSASDLVGTWGKELPLVVIAQPEEEGVAKSFRNLDRVLVLEPSELEVGALVWANSVLATEAALDRVKELAS